MSYMKDRDHELRGVGAIASLDAGNPRRARQRRMRERVMNHIDAKRSRLAFGPGRALPVPLGSMAVKGGTTAPGSPAPSGGMSKLAMVNATSLAPRPATKTTIIQPGTRTPPKVGIYLPPTPILIGGLPVKAGLVPPPSTMPVDEKTIEAPPSLPPLTPTTVADPVKTTLPPPRTTNSGGSGGVGVMTGGSPGTAVVDLPPDINLDPNASSGSMSTGTKVAIGLGVLGVLYFATRR